MSNTDLSELLQQAESQVQRQAEARPARKRNPPPYRAIFSTLLVCLIVYSGYKVIAVFAPPDQQQATHDLEAVIEKAHVLVDKVKAETGELPDTLPNAALASVVRYDHDKDTYSLTATILGIRVTLEPGGKKKTETGVQ
jgi:hypothetical protein